MALPIVINELLHGHAVEWERVEFKEGWNAEEIVQAICAFANDFHNWGGGYLVLGVRTEEGKPVLPPAGLQPEQVDAWQRKLLELGHKIQPSYHPKSEVVHIGGKLILVVWVPGGEMRPYKAPVSLAKGNRETAYFLRLHANTVIYPRAAEATRSSRGFSKAPSTPCCATHCIIYRTASSPNTSQSTRTVPKQLAISTSHITRWKKRLSMRFTIAVTKNGNPLRCR